MHSKGKSKRMRKNQLISVMISLTLGTLVTGCGASETRTDNSSDAISAISETYAEESSLSNATLVTVDTTDEVTNDDQELADIIATYGVNIEVNHSTTKGIYPYVLRTESVNMFLAADDIEKLGKDEFFNGLKDISDLMEQDFAEARQVLAPYISGDIPAVDVITDFCNHDSYSSFFGAYYSVGHIKCFYDWNATKTSLLHEYIHYLTLCCADTKATDEFMKEGIAEYISKLRCENRMARSINYMLSEKAIQNYIDHGACTSDGKSIDYVKRYYCDAQLFVEGYEVGRQYSTVSIGNTIATRTEEMQNNPNKSNASYPEAACIISYLVETYSEEAVLGNMGMSATNFEDIFGKSYPEIYKDWAEWNTQKCDELGITIE